MTGVGVQILDGDTEIVSLRIPYLPRFNSQTLSTTWQVPLGSVHNITVKVNPDRSIEESNYSNNEATRGISVRTPDTIETRATLRGKVTLQGRPESPAPAWIILLTVTLYNPGVSEPVATYEVPTTNKGEFELVGIISATYDIEVKGLYTLSNVKRGVSLPTGTTVDFGTLLEGDCNGDNIILGGDFSLLRTCYGKTSENDGFDSRCDLNQDGVISGADFSLLRTNYYQYGPVELS
jgi:hypothetical protein